MLSDEIVVLENPDLMQTQEFANRMNVMNLLKPNYETYAPGTMRQRVDFSGQPQGEPEQIGRKKNMTPTRRHPFPTARD